jgi:hypothetical protein
MIKKSVLLTALAIAGFAVTSLAQTVPNYVPTNGLVGWWPFNGNAVDESVNTNDGTVNGATLTSDRFGNVNSAYNFDGLNDIITSQLSVPLQSDWSISFWFKSSNINNNFQGQNVVGVGSDFYGWGSAGFQISGQISPGQCPNFSYLNQMYLFDASAQCGGNFLNAGIYNNQWYQIVITKNNLNYQVTINNNTTTSNILQDINIDQLAFGNRTPLPFQYFNGLIDDIGIWNRTITPTEISSLYNGNLCFQTITVTDTLLINTNLTGFNPVTYQNTIKIWPNPTNDHITIDNGNLANLTGHQIKISNALGQQVFQSAITQQQFYVDMSTWGGNGIYFVNLINSQGVTIETRKIVLQ